MRFEMRDTAADDGIIIRCAGECRGGGVKIEDEPRDRRMSGTGDTQRARNQRKPLANQFGPMWPAVPFSDRADLRFVGRAGGFDGYLARSAREEDLAYFRVFQQIQHVRRIPPQLGATSLSNFASELVPGASTVLAVAIGLGGAERRGDGLLHSLVKNQSVAGGLDEGQSPQGLDSIH